MQAETTRTIIRPLRRSDLHVFARYRADPNVAAYQSWSTFSDQDAEALFEKMCAKKFGTSGHWFQLAIEDRLNGELMGDLAVHFLDKDQVEIGFTVSPAHQGKGIGFEAMNALLSYLFEQLGRHRVIAVTDVRNHSAIKLLERLQFRREAHYVENIYFKGAWGSEYQYAMLNREWRQWKMGSSERAVTC